ncbi:uncharacterized protein [Rutidosis leptorrhynchoides]|uniref:uncharacterized protein n=1 Tax=Rutidosis leptorrhynchoides TaxID=125765 RepID=UPI003A998DA9
MRRDREEAGKNLHKHYFSEHPTYLDRWFRRRFRMSRDLFLRIQNDILSYDVEPLPSHFEYFIQKRDALGRLGFTTEQNITSALRQLAYGTAAYMFDEYLQMSEATSIICLNMFYKCVLELYVDGYLRKPTSSDIARLNCAHEEKHGFKGMLGSINCMHWKWKNCPVAWKGQYTSGHQKHPTIVLEAVASYDTWIWHAFFGAAADGIYPDWATLIKAYSTPTDEPRAKFKQFQESARKDVERTFGVLQGRFHILQMAGGPHNVNKLRRILYFCVLFHNMIVEDNGFNITWLEEELLATDEANPNYVRNRSTSRDVREQEIRDRNVPPNFRTMNVVMSRDTLHKVVLSKDALHKVVLSRDALHKVVLRRDALYKAVSTITFIKVVFNI